MKSPQDYLTTNGVIFEPYIRTSYDIIPVLSNLIGKPYNELALAYIQGLNPKWLRVTTGECTTNSLIGRITVVIDDQNTIQSVEQEIAVGIPDGIFSGHHLYCAVRDRLSIDEARQLVGFDTEVGYFYAPHIPKNL